MSGATAEPRPAMGDRQRADATELPVTDAPAPAELAELEDRIYAFNVERTGIRDGRLLAIMLRDDRGEPYAGLHGHTWGGCCEIKVLWVAEAHRGAGLGRRLLLAAEREAGRRGCTRVVLTSHSFQAPGFYERLGYRRLAEIPDYPRGHRQVVLTKTLGDG
jgi:GNAT superfamily N-acetyltransferase